MVFPGPSGHRGRGPTEILVWSLLNANSPSFSEVSMGETPSNSGRWPSSWSWHSPCRSGRDEPAKVLPATEAKNHVDEKGTYKLVVRTTKNADKSLVYYLDSEENFRDEKNLAIVISYEDAEKFKKLGVEDPSTYYKGKTIRVTGKVIHESDQTRIHVTDPKQIEVVGKPKA